MKAVRVEQPVTDNASQSSVGRSASIADGDRLHWLKGGQSEVYSRLTTFGFDVEKAESNDAGAWRLRASRDGSVLWLVPAAKRLSRMAVRQSGINDPGRSSWRQCLARHGGPRSASPALRFSIPFEVACFYPFISRDNTLVEIRKGDPVVSLHLFDARGRSLGEVRCGAGGDGRSLVENERRVLEDLAGLSLRSARIPRVVCQSETSIHTLLFLDCVTPRPAPMPARFTGAHQQFLDELEYRTRPVATAPVLLRESLLPVVAYLDHNRHHLSVPCYTAANRLCGLLYANADVEIPSGLGHGAFEPRHARLLNGELQVTGWRRSGYRRSLATDLVRFLLAVDASLDLAHKRARRLAATVARQWPGLSERVVWSVLAFALLEILVEPLLYQASTNVEGEDVAAFPDGQSELVSVGLLGAVEQGLRSCSA